jgi:lysophospholipase L1-like esterase
MSVESSDPASFGWVETTRENPHGRAVSRFEVMFIRQPKGGTLKMVVDTAPAVEISTDGQGPGMAILKVNPGAHRLTVSPKGDGPVRIVGINMENDGKGMVVDAMGVNGRTATSWLRWDADQLKQWYSRRSYDLVVLAYGTNEANDSSLTPEGYRQGLEQVLQRMRSIFPDTACLLIGPGDRAKKVKDQRYAIWEPNGLVAKIQQEVGPKYGCATWDMRAAMGGEGTSLAWWKAGLMSPDLIHFMASGYQELAGRMSGLLLP